MDENEPRDTAPTSQATTPRADADRAEPIVETPPGSPDAETPEGAIVLPPTEEEPQFDRHIDEPEEGSVLHCVHCGSTDLHESDHASLAALAARIGGATVFTCESCRHRFAVRLFERFHRRHRRRRRRGDSQLARDRRIRMRRRLFHWLWIVLGAVVTAFAVYYFLERDTQRSLTPPDGGVIVQ